MAHNESQMRPPQLTDAQRAAIFDKVAKTVERQFFDPNFNGTAWPKRAAQERGRIVKLADPEAFESAIHDLVRTLGTSHTGFFHQSVRRVPSRLAIAATFHKIDEPLGPVWYAQDVHEGGPAQAAGLLTSDRLVAIDGKPVTVPEQLQFAMGTTVEVVAMREEREIPLRIDIPHPKSRKQPHSQMKSVIVSKLQGNIGYLKVPFLPGVLGLDVAREIDAAMAELDDSDRVVVDLRGHIGGGLGVLRLMSHLTARKLPIGYTVTRKRAERGYRKEDLPKLDRLPTHLPNALAIASMALKFGVQDSSVALVSEGLGQKRWHGRLSVLINEHTISAGEMVAAFVRDYSLGMLVGARTAGRLVPASGTKVGHGYIIVLPRARYFSWSSQETEGRGVDADIRVDWQPGPDGQLARACEELCQARRGA